MNRRRPAQSAVPLLLVGVLAFDTAVMEAAKIVAGIDGPLTVLQGMALVVAIAMSFALTVATGWLALPVQAVHALASNKKNP